MKKFEEKPRKYNHNEISAICRDVLLKSMDDTIYGFAEKNSGTKTTDKELKDKFTAMLSKEK